MLLTLRGTHAGMSARGAGASQVAPHVRPPLQKTAHPCCPALWSPRGWHPLLPRPVVSSGGGQHLPSPGARRPDSSPAPARTLLCGPTTASENLRGAQRDRASDHRSQQVLHLLTRAKDRPPGLGEGKPGQKTGDLGEAKAEPQTGEGRGSVPRGHPSAPGQRLARDTTPPAATARPEEALTGRRAPARAGLAALGSRGDVFSW